MDKITLETFAGKKYAIYGLGFKGDNIKYFSDVARKFSHCDHYTRTQVHEFVTGYNERNGKRWGEFVIKEVDGEIIFDYNNGYNKWAVKHLKDRKFQVVKTTKKDIQITYDIPWGFLRLIKENGFIMGDVILQGIAYWHGIRLGPFWMVEICLVDILDT